MYHDKSDMALGGAWSTLEFHIVLRLDEALWIFILGQPIPVNDDVGGHRDAAFLQASHWSPSISDGIATCAVPACYVPPSRWLLSGSQLSWECAGSMNVA